ncbi:DISARM system phospholipase D-like protein DrmC [Kribbella voronezhensis]|uniref:DISARM system phospholipase D-like protein DrmC n=1 Tax=Kribbella voronezhensis TaxID=2512212 RepID=UPI0021073093|nr:DISARM system phospholipase D-like protein DrmC [Kribbella voronezhensis]
MGEGELAPRGDVSDRVALIGLAFAERWGSNRLLGVLDRIAAGMSRDILLATAHSGEYADSVGALDAAIESSGRPQNESLALLRGVAAGYIRGSNSVRVDLVWSGPSSHRVPVRSTAQVLTDVVAAAQSDVLLMTYSAREYRPLLAALRGACVRGVTVTVVVETLQGAGGAIVGMEPATAFLGVPGVELWHWPASERTESGAKMHAKLAVADRRILFVSSANLTQAGVAKNVEAGLLVTGGTAPQRAVEHVAQLQASGTLRRLQVGEPGMAVG